ncbi:MAG TPA: OmpA family protein [Bacteroidales bacterium]|nr:OmpA family protein [Bacteroidales bacterium]
MKKFLFLVSGLLLFNAINVLGQDYSTENRKAIRFFEKAREEFYADPDRALSFANKAIQHDKEFSEAYILKSEIFIEKEKTTEAINTLNSMLKFDSSGYPAAWLLLGDLQFSVRNYKQSVGSYQKYLSLSFDTLSTSPNLEAAKFRDSLMRHPVELSPKNAGSGINSKDCEFVNAISLDGRRLYFTRKPDGVKMGGKEKWDEDFYFSLKKDSSWQKAVSLGEQINTPYNEGAMHISSDGRFLFYTSCRGLRGFGSCDLYFARRINDTLWEEPFNLGSRLNTRHWETQPCFSSDGRTLFFVSTRQGGRGGADIWMARLRNGGGWTQPKNMGETINTKGEEMAPYLHPDGRTLYFSSNGHQGMGGQDIFVTRMNADSTWTKPQNMGYPVNDEQDQINMIVNASGKQAYISVSNSSGYGCYDIYTFEMPEANRPGPVAYLKGRVYDSLTHKPLEAYIELIDLETNNTVVASASEKDGNFIVALPSGKDYALHIEKEGYLFYSDHFPFNRRPAEIVHKNIPLQSVRKNAILELKNIFFAFDSDSLKPSSIAELNKLKDFLENNEPIRIQIEGHTDNKGDEQYNLNLSERRANAVMNYLVKNDIDKDRLSAKGFGESSPKTSNETESGRAKNRRTEIRVIDVRKAEKK